MVSFVESVGDWVFFQAGKNKAAARLPEQEEDVLENNGSDKMRGSKVLGSMGTTADGSEIRLTGGW